MLLSCQLVFWSKPLYSQSFSALELSVHEQVNQYRASLGLNSLELNEDISNAARVHSQDMAGGIVPFSHDGFEQRVEVISSTIPYRRVAENVAYNQGYDDPVTVAVEGWIDSPGHQQNMVGDFNLTGVGVAKDDEDKYYFTQIFILKP
ncbi:MAG: CAP domain-containing protein [Gloeocapsa sp. DLM2.Bin57]|nr:MAG: CAP domain-containing protein [Gloeocapsa sp. DLM2.Bin57]